jgi:hypothetical protein
MLRTAQCLGCFPDVFFNQRSNLWIGTATVELDVSSLRRVIMAQCDGGMRRVSTSLRPVVMEFSEHFHLR